MHTIQQLIANNQLEEATQLLQTRLQENPADDTALYLLGNIARKRANWKEAIYYYLSAVEINPDSPAVEAHKMVMRILNFSNPDMYNP